MGTAGTRGSGPNRRQRISCRLEAVMEPERRSPWTRRGFLALGALATAAADALSPRRAPAHNLPPGQHGSPAYDKALGADGGFKAVFQSPSIEANIEIPTAKRRDHLLLIQLKNWLNGFQFSYQARPEDLHTVVATY